MDPQIIDHYNEYPSGINVIDKMNEELAEAQKKINKYAEILSVLVQNKVAGRPLIQPITITKEALSEYSQLLYDIKRKINDQLSESKKVGSIAHFVHPAVHRYRRAGQTRGYGTLGPGSVDPQCQNYPPHSTLPVCARGGTVHKLTAVTPIAKTVVSGRIGTK